MTLESLEYKRNIHAKKLSLFKNKRGKEKLFMTLKLKMTKKKKKKKGG